MKKLMGLLIVLAAAGMCLPAVAQEVDKTVVLFRSMDDPNVPADREIMQRAEFWDPAWNDFSDDELRAIGVVPLGASLWSSWARILTGEVIQEKVVQVGTGTLVARLTDPTFTPFAAEAPAYFEGTVRVGFFEQITIAAEGECEVTGNALPEGGPVFITCYMDVLPEYSTPGIIWGQAVSNSTFTPLGPIPGFETGSFWSVQLIWE